GGSAQLTIDRRGRNQEDGEYGHGERQRIVRTHLEQERLEEAGCCKTGGKSNGEAERQRNHALQQDKSSYFRWSGADRHADADLADCRASMKMSPFLLDRNVPLLRSE